MRPAKHLALEHLETINVAFDGTVAPGHGHPRFDGRIVVAQPLRKALQRRECTGRRAGEPAIETVRLAGPHEVRKVPGQRDGLRQLRLLGGELGELLFLVRGSGLRPSQHEPGRAPGGELAVLRLCHDGERLPWAPFPGG